MFCFRAHKPPTPNDPMKLIALLAALLVQPLAAYSSEDVPTTKSPSFLEDLDFRIDDTIASRYWGSIVGGIFYTGGAVNFTDFTITKHSEFGTSSMLIGMINPLDTLEYDDEGGTEYYFGIGHSFDLWEGSNGDPLVNVDLFAMYDALSDIGQFDDDVIQGRLRLTLLQFPIITPYVEFYNWEKSGSDSPAVGWFARAGARKQFPLGFQFNGEEVKLNTDVSIGYSDAGLFGTSSGLAYYRGVIGTQLKLNDSLTLSPSIIGQLPGNQDDGKAFVDKPRVFCNLQITLKF